MKIQHHPDDATILAYAAGALNEGFSLVTAAHLEFCSHCRGRVGEAEALGGELLMDLPPVAMNADSTGKISELIESKPQVSTYKQAKPSVKNKLPAVILPYIDGRLELIRWRNLVPGIRYYMLNGIKCGEGSVRLLSISPGTTIPHHTHKGGEMALILEGAYTDEIGHYKSGDVADLDESIYHQPVVSSTVPCICLMATDKKLQFTNVFSRLLQPLIGM